MTKFQTGRTYQVRSLCDYDCIFSFTILDRSAKTVTISKHGNRVRRKVRVVDDIEHIDPLGRYSMSPVLRADRAAP